MKPVFESPLGSRYASRYMLHLFSPDMRFETWRRLWVSLAKAQHELGLPVTQAQVDELAANVSPINYDVVAAKEKEIRHDVMAHIYGFGEMAPGAKGVIHLGATSCYVTDNADLILYRDALRYLRGQLLAVMRNLCDFADRYAACPASATRIFSPRSSRPWASAPRCGCRICFWISRSWTT
jgi:adenylosuccinate lyase